MASGKESYLDIFIRAKDEASKVLQGVKEQSKSTLDSIAEHSTAIGGAMTAIGGSVVLLTDGAKKTNAALGVTGLQIGATEKEMRDLALATTNITFPLDQVVETFDLLSRSGMRNTNQMQTTANAFSDLGTAIDADADVLAEQLIPAFNAFNIPLEDVDENIDTLTHLFRNTTIDMGDFATTVNRLSPDLDSLGITMEDAAAILEALADKGVQGTAATRLFRTAISSVNSAGDELEGTGDKLEYFYDQLGITTDSVDHFKGEIEGATGITGDFAEAQEKQFGTLDIMKQKWDEWSFTIGSALEPLDTVGAAMAGIGPILMGVQPAMKIFSALQLGTLVPSLTATATAGWAAIAPWLPLVIAIGAVIAIGWLLYNNWEEIVSALGKVWDILVDTFTWVWDLIVDVFSNSWETIISILFPAYGIYHMISDNWGLITDAIQSILDSVTGIFKTFFGDAMKAGMDIVRGLWDGIVSLRTMIFDKIKGFAGGIFDSIKDGLGALWPFSPSEAGVDIGEGLMLGIDKGIADSRTLIQHAMDNVESDLDLTSRTPSVAHISHTMGLNQSIGGLQGTGVGYGGTMVVEQHTTIRGNTFHVRDDLDIIKIARELERLRATKVRSRGIKEMAVW